MKPKEIQIKRSLLGVQKVLESKLDLAKISIEHAPSKGEVFEDHWISVFRSYLPNRYQVSSGFIVDCDGNTSDQIDIVIYDKQYTPTLLDQQDQRYIPAEAVYAVFEVKPHIDKDYLIYAGEKAKSVRKLKRTSVSISHAGGSYKPKEPFPITAGIVAKTVNWSDGLGKSFVENLPNDNLTFLDCGCALASGTFDHFDGELIINTNEAALIYFLFRLLGKLQSLGTVPAIDWMAYAQSLK